MFCLSGRWGQKASKWAGSYIKCRVGILICWHWVHSLRVSLLYKVYFFFSSSLCMQNRHCQRQDPTKDLQIIEFENQLNSYRLLVTGNRDEERRKDGQVTGSSKMIKLYYHVLYMSNAWLNLFEPSMWFFNIANFHYEDFISCYFNTCFMTSNVWHTNDMEILTVNLLLVPLRVFKV